MNRRRITLPHIVAGIFLLIALVAAFFLIMEIARSQKRDPSQATYRSVEETDWGSRIKLNDKSYVQKDGLTTVLLLGIDDSKTPDPHVIGDGYRSDALVLLILNDRTKTMQINMQYAFGESPRQAAYLTKKTVSKLICGRRIDAAAAIRMSGIPTIGDILGGITLTLDEDYSYIDPRYEKGATLTLSGDELERFLRYRDIEEQGSNERRLARQEWLMQKLFDALGSTSKTSLAETIFDRAADYIDTDLDADTISKISTYQMDPVGLKIPGKSVAGELHDEFYVDEEALQELLLEIFYDPAP